ncbi:MAG: hypothetical protein ACK52S_09960, partial [Pirellula sp.]
MPAETVVDPDFSATVVVLLDEESQPDTNKTETSNPIEAPNDRRLCHGHRKNEHRKNGVREPAEIMDRVMESFEKVDDLKKRWSLRHAQPGNRNPIPHGIF